MRSQVHALAAYDVGLHDGSHLRIRKPDRGYDPTKRLAALSAVEDAEKNHGVEAG